MNDASGVNWILVKELHIEVGWLFSSILLLKIFSSEVVHHKGKISSTDFDFSSLLGIGLNVSNQLGVVVNELVYHSLIVALDGVQGCVLEGFLKLLEFYHNLVI